nr:ATP-dependent zinc metalloprotease FTSH 6, chloroplastic [Ipomoea batatas]
MVPPGEDPTLVSKQQLFARIVGGLGGRAAEEIIFGEPEITTGAAGDLQQVTQIARQMVTMFGMSEIGPWALLDPSAQSGDLVLRMLARNQMSEKLAEDIDASVRQIIQKAYEIAKNHIKNNREAIDKLVEVLLEKETLTGDEFRAILSEFTQIPSINMIATCGTTSAGGRCVERNRGDYGNHYIASNCKPRRDLVLEEKLSSSLVINRQRSDNTAHAKQVASKTACSSKFKTKTLREGRLLAVNGCLRSPDFSSNLVQVLRKKKPKSPAETLREGNNPSGEIKLHDNESEENAENEANNEGPKSQLALPRRHRFRLKYLLHGHNILSFSPLGAIVVHFCAILELGETSCKLVDSPQPEPELIEVSVPKATDGNSSNEEYIAECEAVLWQGGEAIDPKMAMLRKIRLLGEGYSEPGLPRSWKAL